MGYILSLLEKNQGDGLQHTPPPINESEASVVEKGVFPGGRDISRDIQTRSGQDKISQASSAVKNSGEDQLLPPKEVKIIIGSRAGFYFDRIPPEMVREIRGIFSFKNPAYYKPIQQKHLYPPEKWVFAHEVDDQQRLFIPRAGLRIIIDYFQSHRIAVQLTDKTQSCLVETPICLTDEGKKAQAALGDGFIRMLEKRFGIYVRGVGGGGRSLIAALLSTRSERTVVVVRRRFELYQWRDDLCRYTDLDPGDVGLVGDGHQKTEACPVIIGVDKSLYKVIGDGSTPFSNKIGQVVVDSCDHVPMKVFHRIVGKLPSKYVLGLAAAARRSDGLTGMMSAYCGPVRHKEKSALEAASPPVVQVRNYYVPSGEIPVTQEENSGEEYEPALTALLLNSHRTNYIVTDILEAAAKTSSRVVVVSARVEHLTTIQEKLELGNYRKTGIITGRTRPPVKRKIEVAFKSGDIRVLLTTTQTVPALDVAPVTAVIVAAPFQYQDTASRIIHLLRGGRKPGRLVEYKDNNPFFLRALRRRLESYKRLGVEPQANPTPEQG